MLSKKAKYAIRAMLHLARRKAAGPVLVKEIAAQERIPQKFLEGILGELTGAGFLLSKTGKGGGYCLRVPPAQITLGRLMRQLDGPLAPIPCVSQMAYAPCADCPDEKTCLLRIVMKQVRDATAQILDETTLEQMLQQEAAGVLDFHI